MTHDDAVITAAKHGDAEAWRELYRAHAGRLVVWLTHRSGTDAALDVDDISSESWLTAAKKIASFNGTSDDFAGWLFGIARKVSSNARRTAARRATSPLEVVPDTPRNMVAGPETFVPDNAELRDALETLSPRERDVVTCIDVLGLDVNATCDALGIKAVAVRVAHHRAMNRLRATLSVTV